MTIKERMVQKMIEGAEQVLADGLVRDEDSEFTIRRKIQAMKDQPSNLEAAMLHLQGILWVVENQSDGEGQEARR